MPIAVVIALIAVSTGVSDQASLETRIEGGASEERVSSVERKRYGDTFDWENKGALEFLDFIRLRGTVYTVVGKHPNWIREDDLPALMELLDSTEPCSNVMSWESSFLDLKPSTIGNEAAYLIEGFRSGAYPPGLNSTRPRPDKDEIRQWWLRRLPD